MPIPVTTKNNLLNGQPVDAVSLHTGFPGTTGANEVTGGAPAYARLSVTLPAAGGGTRAVSAGLNFDVPACTVRFEGLWNGSTFVAAVPNGGFTPKNFVAASSTDLIHCPGHSYPDSTTIVFYNGTPPGGLTEGTTYYTRDGTTDTFKVSATAGGTAIDLTSSASFGCVVCEIQEQVYAAQDVHTVNTITITVPD